MRVALITAIGSFAADIVIKSLKQHGFRVVGTDIYPREWIVDAGNVDAFFRVPLASDRAAYLHALQQICVSEGVQDLLPLTDVEIDVLNENRSWFEAHNICLCLSPKESIYVCRDKLATARLLSKSKLQKYVIPFLSASEAHDLPDDWFPIICKPVNGRSSQGIRRYARREDARDFLCSAEQSSYLIQPLIEGIVVTADLCRTPDGSQCIICARRELLRTMNGAGTSVQVFYDPALETACAQIAEVLQVVGCVNFEFICGPDGSYHFIECNPRFSGGVEFSCIAGYDYVWNHIKCFHGQAIDAAVPFPELYIARKYEEYITARK